MSALLVMREALTPPEDPRDWPTLAPIAREWCEVAFAAAGPDPLVGYDGKVLAGGDDVTVMLATRLVYSMRPGLL